METNSYKKQLDQKAETEAKQLFIKIVWKFTRQNCFTKFGEIDLIFMDNTI